jgi:hypothetical protein
MSTGDPNAMVREALRLDRDGRVAEAIAAYRRVLDRWPQISCGQNTTAGVAKMPRRFTRADGTDRIRNTAKSPPES